MTQKLIDIADLDCIYLTYDEPKKEEFWIKIQNMVPWAKRVDGVKGSDAAHKAAANASDTDYFVLIDGDNMPDPEFFNLQIRVTDTPQVFRWKARNHINGLLYGNGGMSCWHRDFVLNMRTHEASDGSDDTAVEFCFDPNYIPMHNSYSTTYPNGIPFQAWRAGFREGVKMCLNRGAKPTLQEFDEMAHKRNLDNLSIWHNVGRDVENGEWAIYGSRLGTYMTMLQDWDYTQVQWFDSLKQLWDDCVASIDDPNAASAKIGEDLNRRLNLPIIDMDADQSRFFKHHYTSLHKNLDIMSSEMDVIRRVEGW
jgi:hypothetical protein